MAAPFDHGLNIFAIKSGTRLRYTAAMGCHDFSIMFTIFERFNGTTAYLDTFDLK